MTNFSHLNRLKARLPRADRLANATALLHRMLAKRAASDTPFTPFNPSDAPARGAPEAFGASFAREALAWTKGTAQPAVPEALRNFLDHIGQLGEAPNLPSGLDGLVNPRPTHPPAPLPEGPASRRSPSATRRGHGPTSSTSRAAIAAKLFRSS